MPQCLQWYFTLNGTHVSPGNGNISQLSNYSQIDLGNMTYSCSVSGDKIIYEVFVDIGLNDPFSLGTIETDASFGGTSLDCNTFSPTYGILGSNYEGDANCNPLTPTTTPNPNNSYAFHFCISCTGANGTRTFEYDAPIEDINTFSQFGTLGTSNSNVEIYGSGSDYWVSFREDAQNPAAYKNYDIPSGCLDQPVMGSGPGCTPAVVVTEGTPPPTPQNCSCSCPFPPDFQTPAGGLQIGDGDNIVSAPCSGDNCIGNCRFKQTVWYINNGIAYWTHLMGGVGAEGSGSNCECGTTPDPCGSATWCWNEPMKCIAWSVCENAQVGCEECRGNQFIFKRQIPLRLYNKLTGKDPDNLNSTIWVNNGGSLAYYYAQGTAAPDDPDATAELGEYITTIDLPEGCCGDRALHVIAVECDCDADPIEDCGLEELEPNPVATTCQPGPDCLVVPCRGCDNPYCEPHDPPDPTTPDNRPWGVACINNQCVVIRGGPFPDGPSCGASGCSFNPDDPDITDDPPPPPPPPDPDEPTPPPEPPPPETKIICRNGGCEESVIESINGIVIEGYATMEECQSSNCSQYGKYSYICVNTNGSNSCEKFEFEDPLTGYQSLNECEDFCLATTTEAPTTTEEPTTTESPTSTTAEPTTTTESPTSTTETPTTTSQPSGGCPSGYEACGGENTYSWMLNDVCEWQLVESTCEEGCESYPPDFIPLCEEGQQQSANGVCCRPTTTTETPTTTGSPTTTECPIGWYEGWYSVSYGECSSCFFSECLENPNNSRGECEDQILALGGSVCETTPQPPP